MRAKYTDHQGKPVLVESGRISAIRSHQSYSPQVEAVCHRSWSYLTRSETNPLSAPLFHEHHDFPGFPALDNEFENAAHSHGYQPFSWNIPLIKGVSYILFGSIVIVLTLVSGWLIAMNNTFIAILIGLTFGMLAVARGLRLIERRTELYHEAARGKPPAIGDFPLLGCTYRVRAEDRLRVHLGNTQPYPVPIEPLQSMLAVDLYPKPDVAYIYSNYRRIYARYDVGQYFHAGILALENLSAVECRDLEFDHRVVLRALIPQWLERSGYGEGPLATIETTYMIRPGALNHEHEETWRFPLECEPRLRTDDSYTLELRFRWLGSSEITGHLEECRFAIPPELQPVDRVGSGRYDPERQEVIWRNIPLQKNDKDVETIWLSVSFRKPLLNSQVLEYMPELRGSYRCYLQNGLISGITINREHIWNPVGYRAINKGSLVDIDLSCSITGSLEIDLRRLMQDHEYVRSKTLQSPYAPDNVLIETVLHVLVETCKMDVRRIEQAAPRIDPAGTMQAHLSYWDILCRQYSPDMLSAIDVHLVITGCNLPSQTPMDTTPTYIEVWVRCMHDPRDTAVLERAAALLDMVVEELQMCEVGSVLLLHDHRSSSEAESLSRAVQLA